MGQLCERQRGGGRGGGGGGGGTNGGTQTGRQCCGEAMSLKKESRNFVLKYCVPNSKVKGEKKTGSSDESPATTTKKIVKGAFRTLSNRGTHNGGKEIAKAQRRGETHDVFYRKKTSRGGVRHNRRRFRVKVKETEPESSWTTRTTL